MTLLPSRALIRLRGGRGEVSQFLQGLCTQDVERHFRVPVRKQIGALFLNPKGRVLCEGMLQEESQPSDSDLSLLLDVSDGVRTGVLKLLRQHRLRKPIEIDDVSADFRVLARIPQELSVSGILGNDAIPKELSDYEFQEDDADPRTGLLGSRRIVANSEGLNIEPGEQDYYAKVRHLLGVPEGPSELIPNKALPFNFNLDLLKFISFTKGCYQGQELTIRTFHRGQVRKRLAVAVVDESDSEALLTCGSELKKWDDNSTVGTVVSVRGRVALATVGSVDGMKTAEQAIKEIEERCEAYFEKQDGGRVKVKLHAPGYMHDIGGV